MVNLNEASVGHPMPPTTPQTDSGWLKREDRALLEIQGRDRTAWLHNLTTNQIKNLITGEGNYAFALNVQGRILFDLNMLVRDDSIWIDIDRSFLDQAKTHFAKYVITEDVQIVERGGEFARFAILGPAVAEWGEDFQVPNISAWPQGKHHFADWRGLRITVIRHDFCGPPGMEILIDRELAAEFEAALRDSGVNRNLQAISDDEVQRLRIEAGLPWPGFEITEEYLPAETRQLDRAVSFQKGCYLGQEVVERMRSRHVVARLLCRLQIDADALPPMKSKLIDPDGKEAGLLTSACLARTGGIVGLGYVKSVLAVTGSELSISWEGESLHATVM